MSRRKYNENIPREVQELNGGGFLFALLLKYEDYKGVRELAKKYNVSIATIVRWACKKIVEEQSIS